MTIRTAWLLETGQTREDTRLAPLGTFTPTSAVATRSGVLPGSADGTARIAGFNLTGTGMTASVGRGRAVIQGTDGQGVYPVTLTEGTDLTLTGGDPQFGRIDLVVLRIYDALYDSSGQHASVLEVIKGTAAATPVVPAVPALALPLYQVAVKAGASAANPVAWTTAVTDRRTTTVAIGGILPVSTDTGAGSYPGQYRDANGRLERWSGTAWARYPAYPTWQSWTPAWTTTSGLATPTYGNATVNGRYIQDGPIVQFSLDITFGTTTTFGTGTTGDNWRFSMPVPAAQTGVTVGFAELGGSNANRAIGTLRCEAGNVLSLTISSGTPGSDVITNQGQVDSISPWAWAAGDTVRSTATYAAVAT
jgi:hypothetical protein